MALDLVRPPQPREREQSDVLEPRMPEESERARADAEAAPLEATSYYRVAAVDSSGNVSGSATAGTLLPTPAAVPEFS